MPRLTMHTAEGLVLELEVAGAGSRLAAGLADMLLLGLVAVIALLAFVVATGFEPSEASMGLLALALGGLVFVFIAYHLLFHWLWGGRTPGKALLGLRVASADGHPASLFALLLRGLLWPIDVLLMVPVPVGVIVIAVSPRAQRLGDMVARTLVLRDLPATREEPFPAKRWNDGFARRLALTPGAVERFQPAEVELLRELLARRHLSPDARERLERRAADAYLARLGLEPAGDAHGALEELYLFLREHRGRRA